MVELWAFTAVFNAILVVIYGLVSISMISAIIDGKQLRTNPLLTATAAIFVTCTLGHGAHLMHALVAQPIFWGDEAAAAGRVRAEFSDLRLLAWDGFTAVVAIVFYVLRNRLAVITRGAAFCEDLAKRESQALEMHDNIVQGLAQAKMALDLGHREEGYQAIESTLAAARRIMTEVLGKDADDLRAARADAKSAGGAA